MVEFYGTQGLSKRQAAAINDAPAAGKVLRPKVMRNAVGKPVSVNRWIPKRAD
jgi:hypothetical protein